jgi:hypothetical protein
MDPIVTKAEKILLGHVAFDAGQAGNLDVAIKLV